MGSPTICFHIFPPSPPTHTHTYRPPLSYIHLHPIIHERYHHLLTHLPSIPSYAHPHIPPPPLSYTHLHPIIHGRYHHLLPHLPSIPSYAHPHIPPPPLLYTHLHPIIHGQQKSPLPPTFSQNFKTTTSFNLFPPFSCTRIATPSPQSYSNHPWAAPLPPPASSILSYS